MLSQRLFYLKVHYIDTVDPDGMIAKLCFRTALSCLICIALFQIIGLPSLSAWAGFAAFSFVQNDTQEVSINRLRVLVAIILIFTSVVFLGMLLSNYLLLFLLSIPVLVFVGAYLACLGFMYFNAGSWALFLYVLAGSSPIEFQEAGRITGVFLISGAISLLVCFSVLPIRPKQQMMLSIKRVLTMLLLQLQQHAQPTKHTVKFAVQFDQKLALLEKNLNTLLCTTKLSDEKQLSFMRLARSLYQASLMIKSIGAFRINDIQTETCCHLAQKTIEALLLQLNHKTPPNFQRKKAQLFAYRDYLTQIRKHELTVAKPNFSKILSHSNYFYHFLKVFELLEIVSQEIALLQKAKQC